MFIVEAFILLLSIAGVLGVSAALLAPLNNCKRSCATEEEEEDEGIPKRAQRRKGRMQRHKKEEPSMNTSSSDDTGVQEIKVMQVKLQEKREPLREVEGLKPARAQVSSSSPLWIRSLSLGQRRGVDPNIGKEGGGSRKQDSNPGPSAEERNVQRKPSLTGEEVKVLADALIARVRQNMRAQRQDSLKLTSYKAPPLP